MSGLEVIGVVASIIQVADLGAKVSVKLCSLCHTVKSANQSMRSLSSDVALTCSVLQELGKTLEQDNWGKLCSEGAMVTTKAVLSECETVFQRIDDAVGTQDQPGEKNAFLRGAKKLTNVFLGPDLELLKSNLERPKSTMLLMLNVIIYAGQIRQGSTKSALNGQRSLIEALSEEKHKDEMNLNHLNKGIQDACLPSDDEINQQSNKAASPQEGVPDELQQYSSLMRTVLAQIDAYRHDLEQTRHIRIRNGVVGVHSAEAMLFQNAHGRTASQIFSDPFFNFRVAPVADNRDTPAGTSGNDNDSFELPKVKRDSELNKKPKALLPENKNSLKRPPTAGLRVPPRPEGRVPSTQARTSAASTKRSSSKRAILEPEYSPLDWSALASNPKSNLRGANLPPGQLRVTPSMLKMQRGRRGRDAWTPYQGKVYNITPYVPYHPGGKGELLRGAGKDSTHLFFSIHPWVNWDAILGQCLIGALVHEGSVQTESSQTLNESQGLLEDKIDRGQLDQSETGCPGEEQMDSEGETSNIGQLERNLPFRLHGDLMQEKEPSGNFSPEKCFDGLGEKMKNEGNPKAAAQWVLDWTTLTAEEVQIAM